MFAKKWNLIYFLWDEYKKMYNLNKICLNEFNNHFKKFININYNILFFENKIENKIVIEFKNYIEFRECKGEILGL